MRHDERRDAETAVQHHFPPLLQIAHATLQLAGRADIVAERLFERPGQIHGFVVAFREGSQAADMVEMVVGHKHGIDRVEGDVVFGEPFFDGACPDADVDEEGLAAVAEIVAVAIASARKAQEPDHRYLRLLIDLISRGLRMPFSVTIPEISEAGVISKAGLYTRISLGAMRLL